MLRFENVVGQLKAYKERVKQKDKANDCQEKLLYARRITLTGLVTQAEREDMVCTLEVMVEVVVKDVVEETLKIKIQETIFMNEEKYTPPKSESDTNEDDVWYFKNGASNHVTVLRSANRLYKTQLKVRKPYCLQDNIDEESWLWHVRLGHIGFDAVNLMHKLAKEHQSDAFGAIKSFKTSIEKRTDKEIIIFHTDKGDDLFVTGTSLDCINEFKKRMSSQSEMSDLGELTYYLGIEVSQGKDCVMIKKERYARKILKEAGIKDCNETLYPMEKDLKFSKGEDEPKVEATNIKMWWVGCVISCTLVKIWITRLECDSSHNFDIDDGRSTTGHVFYLVLRVEKKLFVIEQPISLASPTDFEYLCNGMRYMIHNEVACLMLGSGKIQKSNKKSLKAKGKGKANGKGNDKQVYISKPKNPKPYAKEHPTKDDACHHYKEMGHWKRNCPVYLAELLKKIKQVGSVSSSVSKNNVFYFNVIPSNGIYEIDMHDLVPNVNSIYNVSTKRAKHNLDSTYLWHCHLAHISKMTRKLFPHRPERATDLLGIIHTNRCSPLRHVSRQEIQSMIDNMVWVLVDLPPGCKTVGSKWIFKKKTNIYGVVHTYKARLVAKGYTQLYGVDYEETFSPVADIRATRILISIAAFCDHEIWQMDVKTASLNGYLNEDIYMVQPEGFVDPNHPKKASGNNVTFLILYVDDIIIMGNYIPSLQSVKDYLEKCFAMKDLGEATFILGIKIYKDMSKRLIRLGQNAYMDKILKRYKLGNSKRGHIPMQEKLDLNRTQGASTPKEVKRMQNVPYASAVGSIICFLVYGGNPEAELRVDCYYDAGFKTDRDDTKSQTGYVFILDGGAVDWKSSK
nr:hypothetical protein [Tanacetum cinerariifolium]